ncbi:hypothetical protein ACFOVU_19695 [Nocardiopsis sediminis]|uniref:Endo-1,4-beta-glucanase n=1 Tax=Nocardiopsis sediminis TaxID=1778267 RepID=A0ABV8FS06_9ACTN
MIISEKRDPRRRAAWTRRTTAVAAGVALASGALAAPAAADAPVAPLAAPLAETCEAFGTIDQGSYWINNNLWGQDAGTGSQCIEDTFTDGDTIGWRTEWQWEGGPSSVKSFSSSVLGWHWGWRNSDTGLPVQLSAGTSIPSSWEYDVQPDDPGTMNVAYDLWLHEIPNPGSTDDPTDEIMIWPYTSGGAGPIGQRIDTVTVDGQEWDLYQGQIPDAWNVYSFVRTSNTESLDIDIASFTGHLVDRGLLAETKYLSSVQAGTEVFTGQGALETLSYSAVVG